MSGLAAALKDADDLRALVKIGIVTKAQANRHFMKRHGIALFILKQKRSRKCLQKK